MKHSKKLTLAVVTILLTIVACDAPDQNAIRIGTSSIGSSYYTLAVAASEIVDEYAQINSTVQAVGGSAPNIFALGNKRIDFAITNSFAAYSGVLWTQRVH